MPKKWYTVTAGREIGVFSDWLEVGASVKGLDDAIYKGYCTEDEAKSAFATQEMKGNTQVIGDGRRFQPNSGMAKINGDLAYFSGIRQTGNTPQRLTASSSLPAQLPSTPPATPKKDRHSATQGHYSPSLHSSSHSDLQGSLPAARPSASEGFSTLASGGLQLSPLKTPKEREAAKARRLEAIKQCYQADALKISERRAAAISALSSSPKSERSSPGTHSFHTADSDTPSLRHGTPVNETRISRVVVKTPDWIHSYPEAPVEDVSVSELLSPLNLSGVSDLPRVPNTPAEKKRGSPLVKYRTEPNILHGTFRTASMNCVGGRASSCTSDSLHTRNRNGSVSEVPVDPRSPIIDKKTAMRDMRFASPVPIADALANVH